MNEHPASQPHVELPGLDKEDIRWNYVAHAVEGGLYIGGLSFVAANTVLPRMVEILGGPAWVISLTPVLTMLGFNLLPLLTAHIVETMQRVKPPLMIAGVFQRLPYAFAGLLLYFAGESHPGAVLWVVVATPLVSGLFGGIIVTAWQELVAKTVPRHRRSSIFALRNIISSMIGLSAGGIIAAVLAHLPGIRGYAVLHLITFVFLALSYVVFAYIREGSHDFRASAPQAGLVDNVAGAFAIFMRDSHLRRFILTAIAANAMFVVVPFLPLHALKVTGRPDSALGLLVVAQMIGGIAGNTLAGWAGDRWGGRVVMLWGRVLLALGCAIAAFAGATWAFALVFFVLGWGMFANQVGLSTISIEFCPIAKRSTYLAIMAFANVPAMLLFSLGGSWLWKSTGNFTGLALTAAALLAISVLSLAGIAEPRKMPTVETGRADT